MTAQRFFRIVLVLFVCLVVFEPPAAEAYIGPGAGFAFVSSFFAIFAAFILAFLMLITAPFRAVIRMIRGRKARKRSRVRKVVIVGLDGQDPELTD